MREVRSGVWHWEAPHPEWKPGEGWDELVSSYAIDDGVRLLLFDPLALPGKLEDLAAERETAILLTCPWHRRDAVGLAERLRVPIHLPPADDDEADPVPGRVFQAGDRPSAGVQAYEGMVANDLVLWAESHRAVVAGDTLIVRAGDLEVPADWVGESGYAEVRERLRMLLELPVEHVLPTHGSPTDRAALERALA